MDRLRASWASAESTTSTMIVGEPRDRDFVAIEKDARRMSALARFIAQAGPRSMPNANQPSEHHEETAAHGALEAHEEHQPDEAHEPMTVGEHLSLMARDLESRTTALEEAARARDVVKTTRLVGEVQSACAECHDELRWRAPPAGQARR
jgi:hypothetical protein